MGRSRYGPGGIDEWIGLARQAVEPPLQRLGAFHGKAGSDPAAIDQLAILPGAQQQGGEGLLPG
ncbi:hypothetical protein D3C72_2432580 [compost metagenome]